MHGDGGIEKLWRQIGDKVDTQISWPWKHFFASKIVLRVIVCCLRGVGSMSYPSIHRTVFFGAPLAFLRGVAMGFCRRSVVIIVGSSFRRLRYILDSGKSTSLGRYFIYDYCVRR